LNTSKMNSGSVLFIFSSFPSLSKCFPSHSPPTHKLDLWISLFPTFYTFYILSFVYINLLNMLFKWVGT